MALSFAQQFAGYVSTREAEYDPAPEPIPPRKGLDTTTATDRKDA